MSLILPGSPTKCGQTRPKMMMEPERTSPVISFGVRDGNSCEEPRRLYPATAMSGSRVVIEAMMKPFFLSPSPSARIDDRVQKIDDQIGAENREGDDQEDALHERGVGVLHGVQQSRADTGVGEDLFHHDRSRDDEPERDGEP